MVFPFRRNHLHIEINRIDQRGSGVSLNRYDVRN